MGCEELHAVRGMRAYARNRRATRDLRSHQLLPTFRLPAERQISAPHSRRIKHLGARNSFSKCPRSLVTPVRSEVITPEQRKQPVLVVIHSTKRVNWSNIFT